MDRKQKPTARTDPAKVLVVDDIPDMRRIVRRFLERRCGCAVWEAGDGTEAISECLRTDFDLIVTDLLMPNLNGLEFVGFLRHSEKFRHIPIIMLTTQGEGQDRRKALSLGVNAYLIKPFPPAEFRAAFERWIPRAVSPADEASVSPDQGKGPSPSSSTRPRVLLAEDNVMNQRLVVRMLERRGYTVVVAGDGRQALAALGKERFDLALMDVQMPEMDGFEATAAIRKREKSTGEHLPVIAMTAYAKKEDRARCLRAGMDDYVPKPIQPEEVLSVIERWTGAERGA